MTWLNATTAWFPMISVGWGRISALEKRRSKDAERKALRRLAMGIGGNSTNLQLCV